MQRQIMTTTSKAKALIGKALFSGLILSHNSYAALEVQVDCAAAAGDIFITESQLEANQCALAFKPNASCGQFIWGEGVDVTPGDLVVKYNNVNINKDTVTPIMQGTVEWTYSGSTNSGPPPGASISFKTATGVLTLGSGDVDFLISMPSASCANASSTSTSGSTTAVPALPLFGLLTLGGLLGLFGLRKLNK